MRKCSECACSFLRAAGGSLADSRRVVMEPWTRKGVAEDKERERMCCVECTFWAPGEQCRTRWNTLSWWSCSARALVGQRKGFVGSTSPACTRSLAPLFEMWIVDVYRSSSLQAPKQY